MIRRDVSERFLHQYATMNESWSHHYIPKSNHRVSSVDSSQRTWKRLKIVKYKRRTRLTFLPAQEQVSENAYLCTRSTSLVISCNEFLKTFLTLIKSYSDLISLTLVLFLDTSQRQQLGFVGKAEMVGVLKTALRFASF